MNKNYNITNDNDLTILQFNKEIDKKLLFPNLKDKYKI
jgi:hypothetical protein